MNFLLHGHLAARDHGSREAFVGAMLPDLWRMADRRVRVSDETVAAVAPDSPLRPGIAHHHRADAWFHAAAVFTDGERLLVERMRAHGVRATRMALLAHPLWEMCIDGALVRREGGERLTRDVAAYLTALKHDADDLAAMAHFAPRRRSPEEVAAFRTRTGMLLDHLANGPWIAGYATGAGLAARLDGVRVRLGLPRLDGSDAPQLAELLDDIAPAADAALEAILERGMF